MKFKAFLKLLRVKHYIKNLLVLFPLFFAGKLFSAAYLQNGILGAIAFCMISSAVYVLNDYRDIESDRLHPAKKDRPLASGKISRKEAAAAFAVCLIIAVLISVILGSIKGALCLVIYFALNAGYSLGLKNIPIIDIVILASGFVIRVIYGGLLTDIAISRWLYLVVTTGSLFMSLGKRRNELKNRIEGRNVLKYYSEAFLDKNMYVCAALANVFYALWTIELSDSGIFWMIPLFTVILMKYSLDVEGDSDGDPVEVILKDKVLIGLIALYGIVIFSFLYF